MHKNDRVMKKPVFRLRLYFTAYSTPDMPAGYSNPMSLASQARLITAIVAKEGGKVKGDVSTDICHQDGGSKPLWKDNLLRDRYQ